MKNYSLSDVQYVYSFYGKMPFIYRIGNYLNFFGKENFLRKKAVKNLNLKKGDKVLDLCCGMGYNFNYLEKSIGKKGEIIGVDYVKEMLDVARKRIRKSGFQNVKLLETDAAELTFPKDYFDGIISTIGISSIPNHKEALRCAIKSLKTNKKIVILDGKLFNSNLKIFNPFIKFFRWSKSWDATKNIIKDTKNLIKHVHVEEFLGGLFFIITGIKKN